MFSAGLFWMSACSYTLRGSARWRWPLRGGMNEPCPEPGHVWPGLIKGSYSSSPPGRQVLGPPSLLAGSVVVGRPSVLSLSFPLFFPLLGSRWVRHMARVSAGNHVGSSCVAIPFLTQVGFGISSVPKQKLQRSPPTSLTRN